MKKIIISCLLLLVLILGVIFSIRHLNVKDTDKQFTHITVAEVAHSVFYTPQYLAAALGYFKDEGLEVEFTLSNGADAVMAAVLSNNADIGFCGTEATI